MKTLITTCLFLVGLFFACEHNQHNTKDKTPLYKKSGEDTMSTEHPITPRDQKKVAFSKNIKAKKTKTVLLFVPDSIPKKQNHSIYDPPVNEHYHSLHPAFLLQPYPTNSSSDITIAASKAGLNPKS